MSQAYLSDLFSLEGRLACVTGASSGIGAHAAKVLARAGAKLVVLARRQSSLEALCAEINQEIGTEIAKPLACDLAEVYATSRHDELASGFANLKDAIVALFDQDPTIVLNAAGLNPRQHADSLSPHDWQRTQDINLSAPFFLAQALVPGMKKTGGGSVVNFASLQSFRAFENGLAYGATKGGVAQMTRAMAQAWSKHGIACNAIAPGFFPTELTAPVFGDEEVSAMHAANTAVGRNGMMQDLDSTLVYLASPASAYVTGQILAVDGGYLAQ